VKISILQFVEYTMFMCKANTENIMILKVFLGVLTWF